MRIILLVLSAALLSACASSPFRAHGLFDRLAHDQDPAGCVLEDVGDGAPDGEVAAEACPVGQAQEHQVRVERDGLVDERGAHIPGLEQLGPDPELGPFGRRLGAIEDRRRELPAARDLLVEVVTPVHLDHVQGDELRLVLACELDGELQHERIGAPAVEAQHGTAMGDV